MGGSQRVLLKKMTHRQTSHPRTWGPCSVNNKLTNKFEKKLILDYPLGILDFPYWIDQSETASYTIRHVLSLPIFLFPFALDHWTRGWVMSHYHIENLPCLWTAVHIEHNRVFITAVILWALIYGFHLNTKKRTSSSILCLVFFAKLGRKMSTEQKSEIKW